MEDKKVVAGSPDLYFNYNRIAYLHNLNSPCTHFHLPIGVKNMIDRQKCINWIKRFNNYILCFILFYTGVAVSSLFNTFKKSRKECNFDNWEEVQDLEQMKKMY